METTKIYSAAYTSGNAKKRLKKFMSSTEEIDDLQAGKGTVMQLTDQGQLPSLIKNSSALPPRGSTAIASASRSKCNSPAITSSVDMHYTKTEESKTLWEETAPVITP